MQAVKLEPPKVLTKKDARKFFSACIRGTNFPDTKLFDMLPSETFKPLVEKIHTELSPTEVKFAVEKNLWILMGPFVKQIQVSTYPALLPEHSLVRLEIPDFTRPFLQRMLNWVEYFRYPLAQKASNYFKLLSGKTMESLAGAIETAINIAVGYNKTVKSPPVISLN